MTNPPNRGQPEGRPIDSADIDSGEVDSTKVDSAKADNVEINSAEDEGGDIEELSFTDDEPTGRIGDPLSQSEVERDQPVERAAEAGLTEAAMPGQGPTDDDLSPETLIEEDGARSPNESGSGPPTDQDLDVTDRANIGAGGGLDEAELGRARPLDGKHWDGDPNEPLQPAPSVDRDYPVEEQGPGNPEDTDQ